MATRFFQKIILLCLIFLIPMADSAAEEELQMRERHFSPCPDSPNCVSTLDDSEGHAIPPYRFEKTVDEAKEVLKQVLSELPRTKLVKEEDDYLHYEVRSFVFRFVDDVEFVFDDASKTLHFRSASRTGTYDFGVNRRRMEEVRHMLEGRL